MDPPLLVDVASSLVTHARNAYDLELNTKHISHFLADIIYERSVRSTLGRGVITEEEAVALVLAHFETGLLFPALEGEGRQSIGEFQTKPYAQATLDGILAFVRFSDVKA